MGFYNWGDDSEKPNVMCKNCLDWVPRWEIESHHVYCYNHYWQVGKVFKCVFCDKKFNRIGDYTSHDCLKNIKSDDSIKLREEAKLRQEENIKEELKEFAKFIGGKQDKQEKQEMSDKKETYEQFQEVMSALDELSETIDKCLKKDPDKKHVLDIPDVMYKEPKPLSSEALETIRNIKERGNELHNYLDITLPYARELAIATAKLEECVMWAVKGVCKSS